MRKLFLFTAALALVGGCPSQSNETALTVTDDLRAACSKDWMTDNVIESYLVEVELDRERGVSKLQAMSNVTCSQADDVCFECMYAIIDHVYGS